MVNHNQDGDINGILVSLILLALLLIAAISFGTWAYSSRSTYKDHAQGLVNSAVAVAKQQESAAKDQEFAEAAKNPLKTYNGPQAYGSLVINYPKTWSGYVDDTGHGSALVDGYFAPGVVPSISDQASVFSLRVQVVNTPYSQVVQNFSGQQQSGKITIVAYALPQLPKVVGVEVNGQINNQNDETMVVLPLRAETLQIWTDGTQYLNDFNKYILPNFSFSP